MLVLYVKNHNIQFVHEINVKEKNTDGTIQKQEGKY